MVYSTTCAVFLENGEGEIANPGDTVTLLDPGVVDEIKDGKL